MFKNMFRYYIYIFCDKNLIVLSAPTQESRSKKENMAIHIQSNSKAA